MVFRIYADLSCILLLAANVKGRSGIVADDNCGQLGSRFALRDARANLGGDVIKNLLRHSLAVENSRRHSNYCRGCPDASALRATESVSVLESFRGKLQVRR